MLRFRLGGIPVEVHFSHLAFSALLAVSSVPPSNPDAPWPRAAAPGSAAYLQATLVYVALWVGIVFVSVLIHELGHALASRAFGYRPSIQLVWLGGNTQPNANETIPWHRDVALTAAGPLAGVLLGLLCLGLARALHPGGLWGYGLGVAWLANLFWAGVNLVPVGTLDGGRIASALLQRVFGDVGFLIAQGLSLAVAAVAVLFGLSAGMLWLTLIFGLLGVRSISQIAAYLRGEIHPSAPHHPGERALARAEALYREGKLEEAGAVAEGLLAADISPALLSRVHALLGWVALKSGQGRPALDHFSQVSRGKVEQAALAAAFSLVGDDHRASVLWASALEQTPSPTVLHEYAGALLREGREEEARRVPGVDLAHAYRCAERVLFLRGEFARAGQMGVLGLAVAPSALTAYDAACAFARAGQGAEAIALLERASALGFHDADYAGSDADLGALHGDPAFHAWLSGLRQAR